MLPVNAAILQRNGSDQGQTTNLEMASTCHYRDELTKTDVQNWQGGQGKP